MKSINQIFEFLQISHKHNTNHIINALCLDSRKCGYDSIFIALKGLSTDGNNYIENVLANGCEFVLTDNISYDNGENIRYISNLKQRLSELAKWFNNYSKPKNIIGITGTNGKTSISHYISQFLSLANTKTLMLGTNGNGIYPNLEPSSHTTLDILSLYSTIAKSVADNLVMEVSSHSLDQNRIVGLDIDVAVFSNLSHDHLDYHGTMEEYFLAKSKLFKLPSLKKAVINIDDEYGKRLCDITNCETITVSLENQLAHIYVKPLGVDGIVTRFELFLYGQSIGEYVTSLIGEFNLMNIALSIGALDNLQQHTFASDIAKITPVKGRMEVIELTNSRKVIIDYAHTPDALKKALQTLQNYPKNNLWCLFGCGGDRDNSKRAKMAAIAEQFADKVVVTEDNNRFENFENILKDIKCGFKKPNNHIVIDSRKSAIEYCIENSQANDIILLAGKGHECYIDKCGKKEFFDERAVVNSFI